MFRRRIRVSNRQDELEAQRDEVLRREDILDKATEFYNVVDPFHKEYPPFLRDMLLAVEENLPRLEDWADESGASLAEMLEW